MRTLTLILVIGLFACCQKEKVCISCIEKDSGYVADDFCGTEFEAEIYKNEMLRYNGTYAGGFVLNWVCTEN